MKVIKSEFVATDANGKDWWRAIIVSDTSVDTPPTTGSGVDGMPDEAGIAAGSVLLTPDGNTVYYTDDMGGGGGGGNIEGIRGVSSIPAIVLSDGTYLGAQFPISYNDLTPEEKEDGVQLNLEIPAGEWSEGEEYQITVVPTDDWYILNGFDEYGGKGDAVAFDKTVTLIDDELVINLTITATDDPDEGPNARVMTVSIVIVSA